MSSKISIAATGDMASTVQIIQPGTFAVGVNLDGLEYNGGAAARAGVDYAVPTLAEMHEFRAQGVDLIRLPISWSTLQPTGTGNLDSTYLNIVKGVVDNAASLGMKVIIDMHDYGYVAGGGTLGDHASNMKFADVWQKLAMAFSGHPAVVGYDLMNEPVNASAWQSAAQAAITAIRTVDTKTAIYVDGNGWSGAPSWSSNNDSLKNLVDPSHNLVFSAHMYLDHDGSGTHFDWAQEHAAGMTTDIGVQRLTDFVNWLNENGLKGNLGEIGAGNSNPAWLTALDKTLALAQANNLQVTAWGAGLAYDSSFGYKLEGDNAPQMAVIDKYAGHLVTIASPFLTGTAEANSVVYLSENGLALGTATADSSGNWHTTLNGLSDGAHTVVASTAPGDLNSAIAAISFNLESAASAPSAPGNTVMILNMSEDAYNGDAQFIVSIDGKQVGGTMTATASHADGQSQDFVFSGAWGSGAHTVAVSFLNDAYDGTASTDRNLYIGAVTMNGEKTVENIGLLWNQTKDFTLDGAGHADHGTAISSAQQAPSNTVLILNMSEDAYNGDAQFIVSIDGKQVGGTMTATASHADGQGQDFVFSGAWGSGAHTVAVSFLNDAYDGTASTDRNLYIGAVTMNGEKTVENIGLLWNQTKDITVDNSVHVINGGNGNDILPVMSGSDLLYGGSGADIFTFTAAAAGAHVKIADFHLSEGDKLDIGNILVGYHEGTSAIGEFVSATSANGNTIISVDRDGSGTTFHSVAVAELTGVQSFDVHASIIAAAHAGS